MANGDERDGIADGHELAELAEWHWVDAVERACEMHDEAARFEMIADLYYRHTGRMRPGEAEPVASGYDSTSKEKP